MRILFAEDERMLSEALVTMLTHNNYSVDAVYDGEDALDYIRAGEYDAAILDIMMPKMDGISVLKAIRADGNNLPVLMLTAKSQVEDKIEGLDSGADDYLTKPFSMQELIARIRAITQDEAMDMAISANRKSKESSTIKSPYGIYKYKRVQLEDDSTMFVFVDCTRDRRYTSEFLLTSILVSLCGFLAVAVLVILLSPMMIKPIVESYDKQKKFITNAGHELKTPLAVIESCTEVMEMESGQTKWTQGIHEQVGRLSTLTGQLVALAKMDERADGSETLPMEDIDFTSLVKDTLKPFELMAEQKGLGFTVDAPTPITIKGNSASLTELINILADNAIKYTRSGGEIKFSLLKKGSHAVLMEENPAEGLSPGSQDALFDRFHRGDISHNNDTISGYGIGLSMAQSIVNAHGGRISASSPDGTNLIIKAEI